MTGSVAEREQERLDALQDLEILGTASEADLDGLASLAAVVCDTEMAAISFVDAGREWFKATVGFEESELARSDSIVSAFVDGDEDILVVEDAADERWREYLFLEARRIRFLAAMPLTTPDGFRVGALTVMGTAPGTLSSAQRRALRLLCTHVMDRLQLRRSNMLLFLLEQEDALRSFYELTADAGLELPDQLNRLLNFGCQLFGMDAGLVGHMTSTGYEIDEVYGPEAFPLRRGQILDVEDTYCAEVIRSGRPAAVPDVRGTPFAERHAYREFGLQAYLGSPLIVDGSVYGCISFFGLDPHARAFDSREIDMQNVMANWVSGRLARVRAESQRDVAYRARADFLARMSHEIRTPLHGVIGMVELLKATELDDEQHALTNTLEVSAQTLLDVINDVLDFSKLEAGKLTLETARLDLEEVVSEALEILRPSATGKGLTLRQTRDAGLPREFTGDRTRLRQVLINVVGNAVKYTPSGEVAVEIARPPAGTAASVEIRIRDTGIGIDPSRLSAIFEPFEQAESSTTRRFGGTGLGLTICASLVRLMGGTIEVDSEPGRGSTFAVRLPLEAWEEAAQSSAAPAPASEAVPAWDGANVLVVDDNETNRVIAMRMLARLGVRSDAAPDGQSGVERAAAGGYDLLLMDISMPVMDGFEALRQLREQGLSVPILAMTASVTPEERETARDAGFTDVLAKPFTLAELTESLRRHLPAQSAAPGDDEVDSDRLDALLELEEPGEQSLLELFAAEARARLALMHEAAVQGSAPDMRAAAHSLKGLAASVGAAALSASAGAIEHKAASGKAAGPADVQWLEAALGRFLEIAARRGSAT